MDELYGQLISKLKELDEVIVYAEEFLKGAPDGSLRVAPRKNSEQYYLRNNPKDTCGVYIPKSNRELVQKLAQKEYMQKLVLSARASQKKLQKFSNSYHQDEIESIYEKLSEVRRRWVVPYALTEKDFTAQWQQASCTISNM